MRKPIMFGVTCWESLDVTHPQMSDRKDDGREAVNGDGSDRSQLEICCQVVYEYKENIISGNKLVRNDLNFCNC